MIVGRLIPAGTGGAMSKVRKIAYKRDQLILEQSKKTVTEETKNAMLEYLNDVG